MGYLVKYFEFSFTERTPLFCHRTGAVTEMKRVVIQITQTNQGRVAIKGIIAITNQPRRMYQFSSFETS